MSRHREPWTIGNNYKGKFESYRNAILRADGSPVGPDDRPRIVACVNLLAGVPTERINAILSAGDTTITSLMLSYLASGDDTVLAMLYDELQARLDSIKTEDTNDERPTTGSADDPYYGKHDYVANDPGPHT